MSAKITITSLSVKQKLLKNIFLFYTNSMFKSRIIFNSRETQESEENWLQYEIYYYKIANPSLSVADNLILYPDLNYYEEKNTYLLDLREELFQEGFEISFQELRFAKFFEILYTKPDGNDLESYYVKLAKELFVNEADYMFSVTSPNYYNSIENYDKLFELILKFRTSLKLYSKIQEESINVNTIDKFLLNNFFISNGFELGIKIPSYAKAGFALTLFKLFETKGTYNSFSEIMKILNVKYQVFAVYLLRNAIDEKDEFRLIKVPVLDDIRPEDYLRNILNIENPHTKERNLKHMELLEDELEAMDTRWQTTLSELKDFTDGFQVIKTHYHYVDLSRNMREVSTLLSLADSISRFLKDDIRLSVNKITNVNLKQMIALLNSIIFKTIDVSINVEEFQYNKSVYNVGSYWSLEEIKTAANNIRNVDDLALFFRDARETIREQHAYIPERYYENRKLFDIETENTVSYKELLKSVDIFQDLIEISTSTAAREFYDEFIYVLDDLFLQLELPAFSNKLLPVYELLSHFKTFHSQIIANKFEAQKWKELLINTRPPVVKGIFRNNEKGWIKITDECLTYEDDEEDFNVDYYFSDDVNSFMKKCNYKSTIYISLDKALFFKGNMRNKEINREYLERIISETLFYESKQNDILEFTFGSKKPYECNPSLCLTENRNKLFENYFYNKLAMERLEVLQETTSYADWNHLFNLKFKDDLIGDNEIANPVPDARGQHILNFL